MKLKLRSLMVLVSFLALLTAVVVQTIRLREAAIREQRLRAELEAQRLNERLREQLRALEAAANSLSQTTARSKR